jgi:hypothetical protein
LKVLKKLGKAYEEKLDWSNPRLLCIAGDFTKYDVHAVQQINRNVELIRYRQFEDTLLLFELVNATAAQSSTTTASNSTGPGLARITPTFSEEIEHSDVDLRDRFEALRAYIEALGDDVQTKVLKNYTAFKRIKNFACVSLQRKGEIAIRVKIDPDTITLEPGFTDQTDRKPTPPLGMGS